MLGRTVLGLFTACLLAMGAPAAAAGPKHAVAIRAGSLSSALHDLARQTRIDLLFDESSVRGLPAPAVRGRLTVEAALQRLLTGTGLTARRTASGAFVIERRAAGRPLPEDVPEDLPVPDILIVGKPTQNVDIRRRQNDVQPYQVTTGREIVQAHRDNLDQYFGSRITTNTQVVPPSLSDEGETLSEIDLRGLGSDGTLVLVDGRRMPSIPGWTTNFDPISGDAVPFGFRQPDVNAIPLHAIERVETLTGTAGGIYGFGALGGVVNVVLKRNYRGLELHGTTGLSSRGDSRRVSLEGGFGFTPNAGRTNVMLYLSHARSQPLLVGERDYATQDLTQSFRFFPADPFFQTPRGGNSVAAVSLLAEPLSFKPEFGGQSLGAGYTFLPVGFTGGAGELVQSLASNAGRLDFSLGAPQATTQQGSTPTTTSIVANARHRFGSGIEGYLDAFILRNRGRHVSRAASGLMFLFADSPVNPFNEPVLLTFPLPQNHLRKRTNVTTSRYTAGIVTDLLLGWRGTAEMTFGSTRADVLSDTTRTRDIFLGPPFGPDINPLGDWDEFQREVVMDLATGASEARARNRYREQSLRAAGPLFRTGGGTVTLSLLAERRRERVPAFAETSRLRSGSTVIESETEFPARSNATTSFYGELRAPLVGQKSSFPLLKELELQLAVRRDRLRAAFALDPLDPQSSELGRRVFQGTSFTLGAKALPTPWLMLRGSYATGAQPPPLELLAAREEVTDIVLAFDPKRGGAFLLGEAPILVKSGGHPELRTAQARTLSLGAVLNPDRRDGPRVSLDYSRIRKSRDAMVLFEQFVLDHEDLWPERVGRAPMTDLDRALGYTGGQITMVDARALNGGGATVDSIDVRAEWAVPLMGGRLRLYGDATWQMSNRQQRLFQPSLERAGYRRGPLEWRANGGADWAIGDTAIGVNFQFFSRYHIYDQLYGPLSTDAAQGSHWVRSQIYADLHASRRFGLGSGHDLTIDLGIVNVLDQAPPRETGYPLTGPGYSRYGDPRRRRFELVLSYGF
jgi:iron complex outermembrane recepter protein